MKRQALVSDPRKFRVTIRRQGANPHVDVPARVSRGFAAYERAGRITVRGALNGAPIRATLIPGGEGRHCLFVSGGMRRGRRSRRRHGVVRAPCHATGGRSATARPREVLAPAARARAIRQPDAIALGRSLHATFTMRARRRGARAASQRPLIIC